MDQFGAGTGMKEQKTNIMEEQLVEQLLLDNGVSSGLIQDEGTPLPERRSVRHRRTHQSDNFVSYKGRS